MERKFIIGSRGSKLALWQTGFTKDTLEKHFPRNTFDIRIIKTKGDAVLDTALSKIGDKGLFTKEIEAALQRNDTALLPDELRGWMPQINSAFYIKDNAGRPEVAGLQNRLVRGLKDLQLLPEDYGAAASPGKFEKN